MLRTPEDLQNDHDDMQNPALAGLLYSDNPVWWVIYVGNMIQDRLAKALLKASPKKVLRFLKKNRGKTFLTWAFLSYMFSPEIWYFKNQWQRVPSDAKIKKEIWLDSVYETKDRETNTIVKLVSWVASQEDVDSLTSLYWNKAAFDTMYANTPRDTVLYKCLGNLFLSLDNPHAWFHGDYKRDILWNVLWYDKSHVAAKVDELRSNMQVANIQTTWVFGNIVNADTVSTTEATAITDSISKQINSLNKHWSTYILNNIMAELWHIRGFQREWLVKYYVDYTFDYIKNIWNQRWLYHMKNAKEQLTHTLDNGRANWEEGILIATLLKMYEEHMPKNSRFHIQRLINFYDWYFENYKDPVKASLYKEKLVRMK